MPEADLTPDGTIASGAWTNNGGGAATFDRIDDDPDAPNTADYIEDELAAGANAEFSLSDVEGVSRSNSLDLRVYGVQGSDTLNNPTWRCELRKADETILATVTFPEGTPEGLRNSLVSVALNQVEVKGLKLVLISTAGTGTTGTRRCHAVKVVMDYISGDGQDRLLKGIG